MNNFLTAAVVVATIGVAFLIKSRLNAQPMLPAERIVAVSSVPSEVADFTTQDLGDGSFLVFLPDIAGADGLSAFSQVSMESGVLGVDPVFTAEANISSEASFRELAAAHELSVTELCRNGVEYLRVEPSDPGAFLHTVLCEVFALDSSSQITVFGERQ